MQQHARRSRPPGADVIAAVGARFGDQAVLSYKKFEKLARFIR
jgi:hypothetical protein